MHKHMYWCSHCGNANLQFDAVVVWDIKKQNFEVECVGDRVWCDECLEDGYYIEGTEAQHKEAVEAFDQETKALLES